MTGNAEGDATATVLSVDIPSHSAEWLTVLSRPRRVAGDIALSTSAGPGVYT